MRNQLKLFTIAVSISTLSTCGIVPAQAKGEFTGMSSWYGGKFHGRKTASGEIYNMNSLTAAHRSLPFNTKIKVTNLANNKSVTVRIVDRGPFIKGRILDLSKKANTIIDCNLCRITYSIVYHPTKEESSYGYNKLK